MLRNEIALLIIPSEIRAEHRLERLQTIARTWGAVPELRASRMRLVALCSAAEAEQLQRDAGASLGAIELLAVPDRLAPKAELLQGVYLGWLDHGPTFDQEMWAMRQLMVGAPTAAVTAGAPEASGGRGSVSGAKPAAPKRPVAPA